MFKITRGKGFHITFENGYTVSVQFGSGNYGDNYDASFDDYEGAGEKGSKTVECAVWASDGEMIEHPLFDGSNVGGYMPPSKVLELLNWAASQ